MKYLIVPLILTLASCSNPADSTVDAKVAEPTEPAISKNGITYVFTKESTIGFIGSKVTGSREGGSRFLLVALISRVVNHNQVNLLLI